MTIKIEMLRCFSHVAQTGNLAEAANRLGRSPSALSMTLKQLEDHLGVRLFESDRKNRLTSLGEQVFEMAQVQLRQFDNTVRAIEASANSPLGLIRIASVPSVVGLIFPEAITTLTRRHPGLKVELRDADTQSVIDSLLQGQVEVGVASGRHALNGVRQTVLFKDRFGLVCTPDHPLARQSTTPTISEVASSGFIRNNLCKLIETAEFHDATIEARVSVHNTLSLIEMVRTRDWVTVLPETVVQIASQDLIFREIASLPDHREVCLFVREKSPFLRYAEELEVYVQIEHGRVRSDLG